MIITDAEDFNALQINKKRSFIKKKYLESIFIPGFSY